MKICWFSRMTISETFSTIMNQHQWYLGDFSCITGWWWYAFLIIIQWLTLVNIQHIHFWFPGNPLPCASCSLPPYSLKTTEMEAERRFRNMGQPWNHTQPHGTWMSPVILLYKTEVYMSYSFYVRMLVHWGTSWTEGQAIISMRTAIKPPFVLVSGMTGAPTTHNNKS